jgi:hypothetical protein
VGGAGGVVDVEVAFSVGGVMGVTRGMVEVSEVGDKGAAKGQAV